MVRVSSATLYMDKRWIDPARLIFCGYTRRSRDLDVTFDSYIACNYLASGRIMAASANRPWKTGEAVLNRPSLL